MCANAETGVGKTLAYAAPLALAVRGGRKAVVSTQTGEATDTEAITGYKQTLNYSATVAGIGVFAFF